jgi:hypothetical protein
MGTERDGPEQRWNLEGKESGTVITRGQRQVLGTGGMLDLRSTWSLCNTTQDMTEALSMGSRLRWYTSVWPGTWGPGDVRPRWCYTVWSSQAGVPGMGWIIPAEITLLMRTRHNCPMPKTGTRHRQNTMASPGDQKHLYWPLQRSGRGGR